MEFLQYQVYLESQNYWEHKDQYFSLMINLINGELTAQDFSDMFLNLWEEDRDRGYANLDLDIRSKGFSRWTDNLFSCCENFGEEAEPEEEYGEKWLKDEVGAILRHIPKDYYSD